MRIIAPAEPATSKTKSARANTASSASRAASSSATQKAPKSVTTTPDATRNAPTFGTPPKPVVPNSAKPLSATTTAKRVHLKPTPQKLRPVAASKKAKRGVVTDDEDGDATIQDRSERNRDGAKGWHVLRDTDARWGSYPSFDRFDDDSDPE